MIYGFNIQALEKVLAELDSKTKTLKELYAKYIFKKMIGEE